MKLEQDHKPWPGFLDTRPEPAGLGHSEGQRRWQSHVFARGVPGEKGGPIPTPLAASLRLPGHAKPDAGQSRALARRGTLRERVRGV